MDVSTALEETINGVWWLAEGSTVECFDGGDGGEIIGEKIKAELIGGVLGEIVG